MASNAAAITVDTTAPSVMAAITAITDDVGAFKGTVASGHWTDDTSLTVSGTLSVALAANEVIFIFNEFLYLGKATVSGTTWTYSDPGCSIWRYTEKKWRCCPRP